MNNIEYGGFWLRFIASLIDSVILLAIIIPVMILIYGPGYFSSTQIILGPADLIMSYVFPILAVLIFWRYRSATPGKIAVKIIIVDAKTFKHPTNGQLILRYLGYFVSMIPFCLGFLWIAFDKRKQGWHDKIAGTVVIKEQSNV